MRGLPALVLLLVGACGLATGSTLRSARTRLVSPSSDGRHACLRLRGGASVEHTYAMLKPDIASKKDVVEAITKMIADAGLTIERQERCRLSKDLCKEFYAEHSERPFYKDLVNFMNSDPVVKMELSGPDAIKAWRKLLGPTNSAKAKQEAPQSVRAKFGTDGMRNAGHGSDSPESAARELAMMFKGAGFPKV